MSLFHPGDHEIVHISQQKGLGSAPETTKHYNFSPVELLRGCHLAEEQHPELADLAHGPHGGSVSPAGAGQGPKAMTTFAERFLEEAVEKSDADLFKDLFRIYPLAEAGIELRCELYDFCDTT